ncbi:MAG TPA: isoamylase early set domain-containing protein [Syntrophorhabdaceae bacterium]|jgi:1,4-alpha-glucan branching enzyme
MDEKKAKKRVTFKFHAPGAKNVCLAGNFNNWDPSSLPLKAAEEPHAWQRIMYFEPGTYQYRFVVDGAWCDDPLCQERFANEFGSFNSVVCVEAESPQGKKKKPRK